MQQFLLKPFFYLSGLSSARRAGTLEQTIAEPLKRMARFCGRKVGLVLLACVPVGVLLGLLEIVFGLSLYRVLQYFELAPDDTKSSLLNINFIHPVWGLLATALAILVLRLLSVMLPMTAQEAFGARIRRAVADETLGGMRESSGLAVSDVSHLLGNLTPRAAGWFYSLTNTATQILVMLTMLSALFTLSTRMTILTLLISAVLAVPFLVIRRGFLRHGDDMHRNIAAYTRGAIRDIRNLPFLKITGLAEGEWARLTNLSRAALVAHIRYAFLHSISASFPQFAAIIVVLIILGANAYFSTLTLVGLVPFVYLLSRMAGSVAQISSTVGQLHYLLPFVKELLGYGDRLFGVRSENFGTTTVECPRELVVEDLAIGRDTTLLTGICFTATQGSLVLISGASGQGKSTLLMALIGLLEKRGGTIRWNDVPIENIDPFRFRNAIGYVGPDPYLIDASIHENLLFGLDGSRLSEADIRKMLTLARADFVLALQGGLDHVLKEGGEGISAGQKQRLALARALLREPHVLLLDEATANVDERTEAEIMRAIRQAFPEMIIIAVSHRTSMVQFATVHLQLCESDT